MDAELIEKLHNLLAALAHFNEASLALTKDIKAILSPPARLVVAEAALEWEDA